MRRRPVLLAAIGAKSYLDGTKSCVTVGK